MRKLFTIKGLLLTLVYGMFSYNGWSKLISITRVPLKKLLRLRLIILILLFILTNFSSSGQDKARSLKAKPVSNSISKKGFTYAIINGEQNSFGYDIFKKGEMIIHQPNLPGLNGNKGFISKQDAIKVALLVIKKLKNNIMPPSVSEYELESLKIKIPDF